MTQIPSPSGVDAASGLSILGQAVCADNLPLMSRLPDGICDLIYVDPPFEVPCQGVTSAPAIPCWADSADPKVRSLVAFLDPRLRHMHRLLSPRGSLYVHLDWRAGHYVKLLLDQMFGTGNFLNEIVWFYRSGSRPGRWFGRKHDTIFVYVKQLGRHTFRRLHEGAYRTKDLRFDSMGRPYKSTRSGPIAFHPEGPAMADVWDVPFLSTVSRERTGYPWQKPERLLERIILASSNEGDVVADFFCGSGVTPAVAQRLGRKWLACDVNEEAVALTRRRIEQLRPT